MKKFGRGVLLVGLASIGSMSLIGHTAHAYSTGQQPGSPQTGAAVTLPQLPAGTFNIDWNSFINNLPIESFIQSLKTNGDAAVNNSIQTVTPTITSANGQAIVDQLDNWTNTNLGFRFSSLFKGILQLIGWVLSLAQTIINWLLNVIR